MATKKEEIIEIRPIENRTANIEITGDSPLIVHAWSAKAKREILWNEIGLAKMKTREPKNPLEDFCSSMYWLTEMPVEFTEDCVRNSLPNARFGFPVTAFKQAALSAAYRLGWSKDKMSLRGVFFIEPNQDYYYAGDLVLNDNKNGIDIIPNVMKMDSMIEIVSDDIPVMREDMVKVGMGSADIRYRGQYSNWKANLKVRYNVNGKYSLDDIVNIINAGGSVCGVGEWRPERDGQYGMYHVSNVS